MGRAGARMGETRGRKVGKDRGRVLVLGSLERTRYRLLAWHPGRVRPALRLRRRWRKARTSLSQSWRPCNHRPSRSASRKVSPAVSGTLHFWQELRDRIYRSATGFYYLSDRKSTR